MHNYKHLKSPKN